MQLRVGGNMSRQRMARLLPLLAAVLLLGSCTKKTPTLNLLVWEGYADPSFVKAFEDENHCKISASYMGSSDELMAKLRGGSAGTYDVISPSSDVATSIATSGFLECLLGSQIQGKSFGMGRSLDRLHGRSGARIRQAGSVPSLQPD